MGRPTKLTAEIQAGIVKAVSIGATMESSAESNGVDYETFRQWMKKGEHNGRYHAFRVAILLARSAAMVRYTSVIAKAAGDGDWRASLEFLKRRDPEHWGDNQKMDVKIRGELTINWDDKNDDD
jgi:hypothetical protein